MAKVSKPKIVSLIGQIPAGNYGGNRGNPTYITEHHIVGDAGAAIARFRTPGEQASSTFVIASNGTIYQLLPISTMPYTDGNPTSNRRAVTIEHAGGHPSVPYTEAMYKSTIHLQAWLRQTYNIPEGNMLMHRQVSQAPTACPGGLDVPRIKKDSTNLMRGVNDMITDHGLNVLFRLYRGDSPTSAQRKAYVGRVTFDAMSKQIQNGRVYASRVAAAKVGKLDPSNHLPSAIRNVYKAPVTPPANAVELKPGLYEVKE